MSNPQQSLPPPPAAIQLTPLFGSTPTAHLQTLYSLYAAQIATLIWCHNLDGYRRSVVVGLALRRIGGTDDGEIAEQERDVFGKVMSMVYDVINS